MTDRIPLAVLPTPLEPMPRLGEELGLSRLYVKRDDQTGLALGGNKARKLERLCAVALARGCDTLVTGGGVQSNHARMTAAAACKLGLRCELALGGAPPESAAGNLLLDQIFGATLHFTPRDEYYDIESAIDALARDVAASGHVPYAIPVGGASVTGALAYLDAGRELAAQLEEARADWLFVADGSGGTHAGLLAGCDASVGTIVGVDVGTRPDLDSAVAKLASETAGAASVTSGHHQVVIDHDHVGGGYGVASSPAIEAIRLAARTEGLLLDPVYSGKAMAALVSAARAGRIHRTDLVVFWHTGGAPALFTPRYTARLTGE